MQLSDFFDSFEEFRFAAAFARAAAPWELVARLDEAIARFLALPHLPTRGAAQLPALRCRQIRPGGGRPDEDQLWVDSSFYAEDSFVLEGYRIFIGRGSYLEAGAMIKGPCLIGENCAVRQGAYLRGNVILGDGAGVGHASEVKGSLLLDHAEAPHFNYVGDSVLGRRVNLGAGTKLANLELRSPAEKASGSWPSIQIPIEGELVDTGMTKLGAILGDDVEAGCNAVTAPGTLIGKHSWIYPNVTVRKGFYPPGTILKPSGPVPRK